MHRKELIEFITDHFCVDEEHPWIKYPNYTVFKRQNNRKWFALIMDIPKSTLHMKGEERIDVLNVKCDPLLIGPLREEKGIYPAYHMNKSNWITVALDGSIKEEKVKWLLDLSYKLTDTKKRR